MLTEMAGLENRIYIFNKKYFCSNVNEPVNGEALFSGEVFVWLFICP
jgi:hypothetical protein